MNTIESRRIWSLKDFSSGILQRWNSTKDQSWAHQICKESRYTHIALDTKSLQHRKNYLDTQIFSTFCPFHILFHLLLLYITTTYYRDNFFTLILKYLLPDPWIDYLEHLEDFYPIGFFFVKVKVSRISLQRFHIIYK